MTRVEVAYALGAELGEGPTWDAATGELIVVDILRAEVHRLSPGRDTVIRTPQHVGAAKPRTNGGLALNLVDGVALLDPDGTLTWLTRWPVPGRRGNDAAIAPDGRLWAGTMSYDETRDGGALYRVGAEPELVTRATVSNGIGWSPDGGLMYYVDSATRRVDVFDVDQDGGVSGRRPFATVGRGLPDGLTVDADGCVWVAIWDGAAVHRYAPDGRLDRVIAMPCSRVTACAFAGTDLYVTTAAIGLDSPEPLAGSVLVVPGAGHGLPATPFAG